MRLRLNHIFTNLTLAAVLALLPVSCCRHNKGLSGPQGPIVLGVSQAGTKAVIDNADNAVRIKQMMRDSYNASGQKTGGFGVHGFKEVNQVTTKLFNNVRVYPDVELDIDAKPEISAFENVSNWAYTPLRYWDRNPQASYQFLAYFPWVPQEQDSDNPYATSTTQAELDQDYEYRELTLHNIPNWQQASTGNTVNDNVMDFMTANRRGRYDDDFSTGTVTLSFNHILSMLVIKAYYIGVDKESQGGVKIMGMTLHKSDNNEQVLTQGTTDFKQKYHELKARQVNAVTDGNSANIADLADTYQFFDYATGINIPYDDELDDTPAAPVVLGSWLFVPYKWQNLKITVDRQIAPATGASPSGTAIVTLGSDRDAYKTQPGKTYVITLMLDTSSGGLTVASVAVQNWTDQKVIHEVYNW